jgi:hypothetical protein
VLAAQTGWTWDEIKQQPNTFIDQMGAWAMTEHELRRLAMLKELRGK